MKPFNEIIYMDNEALSFHFYLIHTVFGQKFFITVNKDRRAFVFNMQKDNYGKWEIVGAAPQWVQPFEEKLDDIITRNI